MRILTVRQPFAWAIVHGGKNVENRPQNIVGNYTGPVAIHAAKNYKRGELTDAVRAMSPIQRDCILDAAGRRQTWPRDPEDQSLLAAKFLGRPVYRGAIIGVVNLVDVLRPGWLDDTVEQQNPWALPDRWHLMLEEPRALREPIPYTGALGLRTLPAAVETQIYRDLGEPRGWR